MTSSTRDVDVAKDRLVDSLSVARDATRAAVKEDIAPAVAAAVGAAREASGPIAAEAASRASEAVTALRGTSVEAAKAVRKADVAKKVAQSDVAKKVAQSDVAKKLAQSNVTKAVRNGEVTKAVRNSDTVNRALRRKPQRSGRKRWTVTALLIAAGVIAGSFAKRRKQSTSSYPTPNAYPAPTPPTESTAQSSAMGLPVTDPTAETPTTKKK